MTVNPLPSIRFAMLSSVGRVRSGNEDFCAASADLGVFIVCDGMGGAAAGEVASQLAATTFLTHLSGTAAETEVEPRLRKACGAANAAVFEQAQQTPSLKGMGTTLVALMADPDAGRLWLIHIGDSRCYRLRGDVLEAMTEDHSLVQEQVRAGQITPAQAEVSPVRNIITRAVGAAPEVEPEVSLLSTEPGDLYLLASDGLTRELTDEQISAHLRADGNLAEPCDALVAEANAAGGHDNITVLVVAID